MYLYISYGDIFEELNFQGLKISPLKQNVAIDVFLMLAYPGSMPMNNPSYMESIYISSNYIP